MSRIFRGVILVLAFQLAILITGVLAAQDGFLSFFTPGKTRLTNNLKQIGLAMHNYHDTYKSMPPIGLDYPKGGGEDKPKEMLSWRVRILPFIEQAPLYKRFNFNEPWDGPTNKPLLAEMPEIFKSPGASLDDPTKTLIQAVTMDLDSSAFQQLVMQTYPEQRRIQTAFDMIFQGRRPPGFAPIRFASMIDGLSNSLFVVETDVSKAVLWTKPDDLQFKFDKPWEGLGGLRKGHLNFVMGDGLVGSFSKDQVDDAMLRDAFFISDGRPSDKFRALVGGVKY